MTPPDAVLPYLEGGTRARFDAWLEAVLAREMPPLSFQELRKGVQALSALYVERRDEGPLAPRARRGRGKRAAFASYYAALHFLTAHHVLCQLGPARLGGVRRVVDLGCGTAAAGAAVARALAGPPEVLALDAARWSLPEARHTLAAFGLAGRVRRAALPNAVPAARPGDLLLLAWAGNELDDATRDASADALDTQLRRGARLLVLEPLAGPASPWWPDWVHRFRPAGLEDRLCRFRIERPLWIAKMDRAAGLDHRELGARVLVGPLGGRGAFDARVTGGRHAGGKRRR